MSATPFFSDEELRRIEEAVKQAESQISGEIVPVFVARSDAYEYGNLRAGLSAAAVAVTVWMLLFEFGTHWGGHWFYAPESLLSLGVIAFLAAFSAARWLPGFRRLFLLGSELDEAVDRAARMAFLREEVFHTSQRTGILIFISRFEHRVEVLGDTGISAKVSADEWKHIVQTIVQGLKTGRKTEGICQAVDEARVLLLKNGFTIAPGDINELPDNLRL